MKPLFGIGVLCVVAAGVTVHTAEPVQPLRESVVAAIVSDACVKLVRSEPFPPDESPMPKYPEAAKEAHVEGDVLVHFEVGSGCASDEITVDDGPEMLRQPVEDAVKDWKYCGVPEGQEIHATIAFRLNCPAK
jgi:outer membrane biosynthesis protein TonB